MKLIRADGAGVQIHCLVSSSSQLELIILTFYLKFSLSVNTNSKTFNKQYVAQMLV